MKYLIVKENVKVEEKEHTTYGIQAVSKNTAEPVGDFHDVSVDRSFVENVVNLLNTNDVELLHFRDVVIDELNR